MHAHTIILSVSIRTVHTQISRDTLADTQTHIHTHTEYTNHENA